MSNGLDFTCQKVSLLSPMAGEAGALWSVEIRGWGPKRVYHRGGAYLRLESRQQLHDIILASLSSLIRHRKTEQINPEGVFSKLWVFKEHTKQRLWIQVTWRSWPSRLYHLRKLVRPQFSAVKWDKKNCLTGSTLGLSEKMTLKYSKRWHITDPQELLELYCSRVILDHSFNASLQHTATSQLET